METRLENCLRNFKIGNKSTEHPKKFINDLAYILMDNCSTEIDSAIQRQNSLEALLGVSPMMVVRNSDIGLFASNLSTTLTEPLLFSGVMQFLNRLLLIKDEQVWIKLSEQFSQNADALLDSDQLTTSAKVQFVDFILQLIANNSHIFRHFLLDVQKSVVGSLITVLRPNSKFLTYSILLNPSVSWLRPRISTFSHRLIVASTLIEIINNFLSSDNHDNMPKPQIQCFYFSLLLYCIKYSDLLNRLDQQKVADCIRNLMATVLKKKKLKCATLLVETSESQTPATFFATYLLDALAFIKQPFSIKICSNVLKNCTDVDFSNHSTALISLIENGLKNQNANCFQLAIELMEVLHIRNWNRHIAHKLDQSKLFERLEPRTSSQHTRLLLAYGLTENQRIWTHSFKHFIRSPWLYFVEHPLLFSTVEERHVGNRLINKFISFGEDRFGSTENKWEHSCLMWMLVTQPFLISQLVDPFDLTLQLNEQFQKISQNQQSDFLQRISMLVSNLDTLVKLRKHFSLTTKLPQMVSISNDNKIIIDERFTVLTPFIRQWFIVGVGDFEFKKMADLRLFVNGSSHKKQLTNFHDLKLLSISIEQLKNYATPLNWLQSLIETKEQECDYQTFVASFVDFVQSKQTETIDSTINFTMTDPDELIIDYAFGLGLVSNKRPLRLKLANISLPQPVDNRNDWFLATLLLFAKFDMDLVSRTINGILSFIDLELTWPALSIQTNGFFASIQQKLMPLVHKLLSDSYFELVRQRVQHSNVPLFHLLAHFTYRNYIGFISYEQLVEYFAMQLIVGPHFQAIFFVLIVEHICTLNNEHESSITLRQFFIPDLDNFVWRSRRASILRSIEILADDEENV
ncbi:hypothetical protein M3Y97_00378000 [Aphelenchoides bicaudatus]|nr:hypothetical protein M3Y97_00378000 [Aphelenchoides bicaudatus]